MGIDRIKFTGIKEGDYAVEAGESYVGGSPAAININGHLVKAKYGTLAASKTDSTAVSYVGVFVNTSGVDGVQIESKATYYAGPTFVTFTKLLLSANNANKNAFGGAGVADDDYPYDHALTFAPKDLLFIDTNGKWTNVNPASTPCFGVVLAVGTNFITVQLYGGPTANF